MKKELYIKDKNILNKNFYKEGTLQTPFPWSQI